MLFCKIVCAKGKVKVAFTTELNFRACDFLELINVEAFEINKA
jgi:hypothetical protein